LLGFASFSFSLSSLVAGGEARRELREEEAEANKKKRKKIPSLFFSPLGWIFRWLGPRGFIGRTDGGRRVVSGDRTVRVN
jgi:hypothetical protein